MTRRNTWLWILGGAAAILGTLYYVRKSESERQSQIELDKIAMRQLLDEINADAARFGQ